MSGFNAVNLFGAKGLEGASWAQPPQGEGANPQPAANLSTSFDATAGPYRTIQKVLSQFVPPAPAPTDSLTVKPGKIGETGKDAEAKPETEKSSARADVLAFVAGIGIILLAWGALVVIRMLL
jgi:hypothetical protein